ncbi:hypothetical protein Btru_048454 [Bulinus truncatus]|nr:hypothetical protein Btru_048454 [Bulinus truncatus]
MIVYSLTPKYATQASIYDAGITGPGPSNFLDSGHHLEKESRGDVDKSSQPKSTLYLTSNCVILTYFTGETASVVDEHFTRALSQPSSYTLDKSGPNTKLYSRSDKPQVERVKLGGLTNILAPHPQDYDVGGELRVGGSLKFLTRPGETPLMCHRKLPPSFWNSSYLPSCNNSGNNFPALGADAYFQSSLYNLHKTWPYHYSPQSHTYPHHQSALTYPSMDTPSRLTSHYGSFMMPGPSLSGRMGESRHHGQYEWTKSSDTFTGYYGMGRLGSEVDTSLQGLDLPLQQAKKEHYCTWGSTTWGSTTWGTTTWGSTNQGSTTWGSTNQGSTTWGSTTQGTTTWVSTTWGSTNQGSTTWGSTTQGSTTWRSTNQGSTTWGSTTQGSTTWGSTNQGSITRGSTNQGSTTQGTTNQGSTTWGSTTQGSTTLGSTTQGSIAWGSTTWGSTTWGFTTWGSTTWGSTTWGFTTWGSSTQGSTAWGSTTWESTTWGSTTWGSTTWGSTIQGSTTQGSTTQCSTTQGSTTWGFTTIEVETFALRIVKTFVSCRIETFALSLVKTFVSCRIETFALSLVKTFVSCRIETFALSLVKTRTHTVLDRIPRSQYHYGNQSLSKALLVLLIYNLLYEISGELICPKPLVTEWGMDNNPAKSLQKTQVSEKIGLNTKMDLEIYVKIFGLAMNEFIKLLQIAAGSRFLYGNGEDMLAPINGMAFSTRTRSRPRTIFKLCEDYQSGWWFDACPTHGSNLNGMFGNEYPGAGVVWLSLTMGYTSVQSVEMKIREI